MALETDKKAFFIHIYYLLVITAAAKKYMKFVAGGGGPPPFASFHLLKWDISLKLAARKSKQ